MLHQADVQWLEELRKNLACYLSDSSSEASRKANRFQSNQYDQLWEDEL